jgi:uncharacterized delta-60 repeat protein
MEVRFKRSGERRYTVTVLRDGPRHRQQAPRPSVFSLGVAACLAGCGQPHAKTGSDAGSAWGADAQRADADDAGIDASGDANFACVTPGSIDLGFGTGGTTILARGQRSIASTVVIDPTTSNIIVGGSTGDPDGHDQFTVVRLLPNGAFDPIFGNQGVSRFGISGTDCWLEDVALQSDGKIVGVGGSNGLTAQLVVLRLMPDGTLDQTFGTDGMVVAQPSIFGHGVAIALDSAQRIVIAAESWDGPDPTSSTAPSRFTIARYLPSGILDSSFGTGGVAVQAFSGYDLANDMVLQSDDRIVVAGMVDMDQKSSFGVARYASDGSLDQTFGSGGMARVPFSVGAGAQGLALDSSGSVLLAGDATDSPNPQCGAAARLLSDGTVDTRFAAEGMFTTCVGPNPVSIEKTAISPVDEKMVIAGWVTLGARDLVETCCSRVSTRRAPSTHRSRRTASTNGPREVFGQRGGTSPFRMTAASWSSARAALSQPSTSWSQGFVPDHHRVGTRCCRNVVISWHAALECSCHRATDSR